MQKVTNLIPRINAGQDRTTSASVQEQQLALSQEIIPAEPGEYYSYSSVFTDERPLYVLMKCKSNKARMMCELAGLGSEVNALFRFEGSKPQIVSIKAAEALGLLEKEMFTKNFNDIWFAPTDISIAQFETLRARKIPEALVTTCKTSLTNHQIMLDLHEGLVVAFITNYGKCGLFLVKEIQPSLIWIEACHILI